MSIEGGAWADELASDTEIMSELAESIWDSPLFFGRRDVGMGRVVTLWALLVLVLNTLLQTTIAVIVLLKMGDPTFVARIIEDLRYASERRFASDASERRFASECHALCPGWVIIYTAGSSGAEGPASLRSSMQIAALWHVICCHLPKCGRRCV
jgi:hypothetical protein